MRERERERERLDDGDVFEGNERGECIARAHIKRAKVKAIDTVGGKTREKEGERRREKERKGEKGRNGRRVRESVKERKRKIDEKQLRRRSRS